MYYLESKEPRATAGRLAVVWKPICYGTQREPLDEAVQALGSENYRVTLGIERKTA